MPTVENSTASVSSEIATDQGLLHTSSSF